VVMVPEPYGMDTPYVRVNEFSVFMVPEPYGMDTPYVRVNESSVAMVPEPYGMDTPYVRVTESSAVREHSCRGGIKCLEPSAAAPNLVDTSPTVRKHKEQTHSLHFCK
jgi:hypothetical protein